MGSRKFMASNANLSGINLHGTRLKSSNLTEANLSGAIWINRQTCAAGSVGRCILN